MAIPWWQKQLLDVKELLDVIQSICIELKSNNWYKSVVIHQYFAICFLYIMILDKTMLIFVFSNNLWAKYACIYIRMIKHKSFSDSVTDASLRNPLNIQRNTEKVRDLK